MHIHPHTHTSWLRWPFFEDLLVAVVGGLPVLFVWAFIRIMMDENQRWTTVFRTTKEILTGVSAPCGDPCGELRFPAKGLCNIMGKRSWIDFSFASVMQQQNKLRCFTDSIHSRFRPCSTISCIHLFYRLRGIHGDRCRENCLSRYCSLFVFRFFSDFVSLKLFVSDLSWPIILPLDHQYHPVAL